MPQGYGSFNFLAEAGYNFSVDNERSQYFQSSFHLDYDVANLHRFYPLIELNWFYLAKRGDTRDLPFEGTDLVNFGSARCHEPRSGDAGFRRRYKYCEWLQFGTTVGFPLTGNQGFLTDWRITFDVIFRY